MIYDKTANRCQTVGRDDCADPDNSFLFEYRECCSMIEKSKIRCYLPWNAKIIDSSSPVSISLIALV